MLEVAEKQTTKTSSGHLPKSTVGLVTWGYFAASVAIVAAAAFALDRWIIPAMENSGQLESYLWTDENHRRNHFTYLKTKASKADPVWRSEYIPVAAEHPGKKRILVLGDSFVWGDGSDNVNTLWWRQLDQELKKRGYGDVEVIAAGLNGSSTADESKWLDMLLPKYKPDLVVLGYVTNDPDEARADGTHYVPMMAKELPDDDANLNRLAGILPNLAGQLRQIRKLSLQNHVSAKTGALEYADWELALLRGDNFNSYEKTVAELANKLKTASVPAFAIALPAGFQNKTKENTAQSKDFFERVKTYNSERYAPVKPVFAKNNLLFVDTTDAFVKAAAQDPYLKTNTSALRLGINPGNGHPGIFSTHFYAVSAADVIEKNFADSLGKKVAAATKSNEAIVNDCVPPYMNAQNVGDNTINFTYAPDAKDHTLYMPLRRRYVLLSLREPVATKAIELKGPELGSAQIYVSYFDEKLGYAPDVFEELPKQKGSALQWNIAGGKKINAIRLRAGFTGGNQALTLKLQ